MTLGRVAEALPYLDEALGLLDAMGINDWVDDALRVTAAALGGLPAGATPGVARAAAQERLSTLEAARLGNEPGGRRGDSPDRPPG